MKKVKEALERLQKMHDGHTKRSDEFEGQLKKMGDEIKLKREENEKHNTKTRTDEKGGEGGARKEEHGFSEERGRELESRFRNMEHMTKRYLGVLDDRIEELKAGYAKGEMDDGREPSKVSKEVENIRERRMGKLEEQIRELVTSKRREDEGKAKVEKEIEMMKDILKRSHKGIDEAAAIRKEIIDRHEKIDGKVQEVGHYHKRKGE